MDAKSLYDCWLTTQLEERIEGRPYRCAGAAGGVGRAFGLHSMDRSYAYMPADCLTKKGGRADSLMRWLESGRFGVAEEANYPEFKIA